MGNMPMKFGYNLRTFKITHTRMGGDPYALWVKIEVFKMLLDFTHTHFLDSREHTP